MAPTALLRKSFAKWLAQESVKHNYSLKMYELAVKYKLFFENVFVKQKFNLK